MTRKGVELHAPRKRLAGFSLTELVVALAVAMILMAVGLPAFLRAYRNYELSNAATQVADILRLARYEAIRENASVQCMIQASGSNPGYTNVWVDSTANNALDSWEKTFLLGPSGNLVDGGSLAGTSAMLTSAVGSFAVQTPSPSSSAVKFDARGAVVQPDHATVFYLSSSLAPDAGYRAVVLMPAGSIQIWTTDTSGSWQQQR